LNRSLKDLCDWYRLNENDPTAQKAQWSFSINLRHHNVNSSGSVFFHENFMEDKLTVLCVIFREIFTAPALSVGVIFREN